ERVTIGAFPQLAAAPAPRSPADLAQTRILRVVANEPVDLRPSLRVPAELVRHDHQRPEERGVVGGEPPLVGTAVCGRETGTQLGERADALPVLVLVLGGHEELRRPVTVARLDACQRTRR